MYMFILVYSQWGYLEWIAKSAFVQPFNFLQCLRIVAVRADHIGNPRAGPLPENRLELLFNPESGVWSHDAAPPPGEPSQASRLQPPAQHQPPGV